MPRTLKSIPSAAKRLTRDEKKAQTRERLLEVGRKHILEHGLGDVVAERIAEEAGYSRGAFYSNFDNKDDLFLAIIEQENEAHLAIFEELLQRDVSGPELLHLIRGAFADKLTNPDWIVLQAEFQAGALRSQRIRECYLEQYRLFMKDGCNALNVLGKIPEIRFALPPEELFLTLFTFAHGLAVNLRLLGTERPSQKQLRKLLFSVHDKLVSIKPAATHPA
ncbi:MAG: TetR/AcrR family transcriptional regulator [Acidobacteriaceae bacterium]|nr:TetR/AcrR family transcriptional regulator [Acidobacteriaceae bacterium]